MMSGQIAAVEAENSARTASDQAGQPGPSGHTAQTEQAEQGSPPEVTIQDVLVEDVSIDGMCGVY
jgi:mycofactocin precursor